MCSTTALAFSSWFCCTNFVSLKRLTCSCSCILSQCLTERQEQDKSRTPSTLFKTVSGGALKVKAVTNFRAVLAQVWAERFCECEVDLQYKSPTCVFRRLCGLLTCVFRCVTKHLPHVLIIAARLSFYSGSGALRNFASVFFLIRRSCMCSQKHSGRCNLIVD